MFLLTLLVVCRICSVQMIRLMVVKSAWGDECSLVFGIASSSCFLVMHPVFTT